MEERVQFPARQAQTPYPTAIPIRYEASFIAHVQAAMPPSQLFQTLTPPL